MVKRSGIIPHDALLNRLVWGRGAYRIRGALSDESMNDVLPFCYHQTVSY